MIFVCKLIKGNQSQLLVAEARRRRASPRRRAQSQFDASTRRRRDVRSMAWRWASLISQSTLTGWSICTGRPKARAALASYLIFRRSLGGRRRRASVITARRRNLRRSPWPPPRRRPRRAAPSAPETRSDGVFALRHDHACLTCCPSPSSPYLSNAVAATSCLAAHRHQSQSNENQ